MREGAGSDAATPCGNRAVLLGPSPLLLMPYAHTCVGAAGIGSDTSNPWRSPRFKIAWMSARERSAVTATPGGTDVDVHRDRFVGVRVERPTRDAHGGARPRDEIDRADRRGSVASDNRECSAGEQRVIGWTVVDRVRAHGVRARRRVERCFEAMVGARRGEDGTDVTTGAVGRSASGELPVDVDVHVDGIGRVGVDGPAGEIDCAVDAGECVERSERSLGVWCEHQHAATTQQHVAAGADIDRVRTHVVLARLRGDHTVERMTRAPTAERGREITARAVGDEAGDLTVDVDVDLEWPLRLRIDGPARDAERVAGVGGDVE